MSVLVDDITNVHIVGKKTLTNTQNWRRIYEILIVSIKIQESYYKQLNA